MPADEPRFVAPTTVPEALDELAEDGAMVLGGGTATALLLKNGLVQPSKLVWLEHVDALRGIDVADGSLRIGATTTLRELARAELPGDTSTIAEACGHIGNARVRAVATVGGAMVHGDPRQDLPPVLLALGATVRVAGAGGTRDIPVADLYVDFMETAVGEDEIVTEVLVPLTEWRRSTYARFTPSSDDDYPTVGVAASLTVDDDGLIGAATVALAGVAPTVVAAPGVTEALVGRLSNEVDPGAVAELAMAAARPTDDQRGSAAYKRAMAGTWTARAMARLL